MKGRRPLRSCLFLISVSKRLGEDCLTTGAGVDRPIAKEDDPLWEEEEEEEPAPPLPVAADVLCLTGVVIPIRLTPMKLL